MEHFLKTTRHGIRSHNGDTMFHELRKHASLHTTVWTSLLHCEANTLRRTTYNVSLTLHVDNILQPLTTYRNLVATRMAPVYSGAQSKCGKVKPRFGVCVDPGALFLPLALHAYDTR